MQSHFKKEVQINAPVKVVFDWHEQPGTLQRLTPPWEHVTLLSRTGGLQDGGRVKLRQFTGPIPMVWEMEHFAYEYGVQFGDKMLQGPFTHWHHLHQFKPIDEASCILTDDISYKLPLHPLARLVTGGYVQHKLESLFTYRHAITQLDCERYSAFLKQNRPPLNIVIGGGSQKMVAILTSFLTTQGHAVQHYQPNQTIEKVDAFVSLEPNNPECQAKYTRIQTVSFQPQTYNLSNWRTTEESISEFYQALIH